MTRPKTRQPVTSTSPLALVVEPDEKYAFLLNRYLELLGVRAEVRASIPSAEQILTDASPEFVILDTHTFHSEAKATILNLRAIPGFEKKPILVCHWAHEPVLELEEEPGLQFIEKPVGFADFAQALSRLGVRP
jgi:DNA-binding NtrC family response regulator